MIEWYDDKDLTIKFSDTPHVCIRYILPTHTDSEKKSIEKYPFICKTELKVALVNKAIKQKGTKAISSLHSNTLMPQFPKTYTFTIPKGYCYDGATIPRLFWRLIGANTDNRFLIAALVHDVLCENHNYVDNNRYFANKVFERLLYVSDVPAFNRWLMFHSVDNWQKFCGWG